MASKKDKYNILKIITFVVGILSVFLAFHKVFTKPLKKMLSKKKK